MSIQMDQQVVEIKQIVEVELVIDAKCLVLKTSCKKFLFQSRKEQILDEVQCFSTQVI